mgnify:CR=1 FL=1
MYFSSVCHYKLLFRQTNKPLFITLYNKIALLYKSNEVTIWVNGVKGTSDTSASMPIGLSEFNLNYTYSLPLYSNVKCVAVFKEALSDTELQKLKLYFRKLLRHFFANN